MANYMADVAKLLGVEMNKDFECEESSCTYRITENGLTCNGCYGADSLMYILNGEKRIKQKPWKPKYGDHYWAVSADPIDGICYLQWEDSPSDYSNYKLGNCYKTRMAAQENKSKWVSFYASDEVLEV